MTSPSDVRALATGTVGLVADVHGNQVALQAVVDHGRARGVDRWITLGDLVAMGPQPGAVLEILAGLDVVAAVSGNTERYVLTGARPDPTFADVLADPQRRLPQLVEVEGSFAWTKGFLAAQDHLKTLALFTPAVRFVLPDGTRVLLVHASLMADDGHGIDPGLNLDRVEKLFGAHDADVVIGGHTHARTDRTIGGTRFVNPGSVSNHSDDTFDARYITIDVAADHHVVAFHDVAYPIGDAVAAIEQCGIPGSAFLLRKYFGHG